MANGAVYWASQQQKTVAFSVVEAGYMELASVGKQISCHQSISREIGFPLQGPLPLCADIQAVIFLTVKPTVEHKTKHINI